MAALISELRQQTLRESLARLQKEIAQAVARRAPGVAPAGDPGVEILAATKYVALENLPVLAEAGVRLVGENRAQDLQARACGVVLMDTGASGLAGINCTTCHTQPAM